MNHEGVAIGGAMNVDWEDLASDKNGYLYIADFGNNGNMRRDLVFYVIPEPRPTASNTTYYKKLFFKYPDQNIFPDSSYFNFDAEACFFANGTLWILTKHRSDTKTTLYKLPDIESSQLQVLEKKEQFDIEGMVTAADISEDELSLVVTTYKKIWLFNRNNTNAPFLSGDVYSLDYSAYQVESITFKNKHTLLLVCELTSEMYEISINDLNQIKN